MSHTDIVKDIHFEEIAEVKPDSKHRVALGRKYAKVRIYKVYRNSIGQIILDPQITIPAHEAWLFKNKKAATLVQKGLEDARKGRLVEAKEDFSKYIDND